MTIEPGDELVEGVKVAKDGLRRRIAKAGGDPDKVSIVAVTKGHGVEAVTAAVRAGFGEIGENYADEMLSKSARLPESLLVHWHFLGAVQRNKVAKLSSVVSCWQSVSRSNEAEAIARRSDREPEIFVEVDFSGMPGRGGCSPAEAPSVVEAAFVAGCRVRGLMTVAPLVEGLAGGTKKAAAEDAFGRCAALAHELGLSELSMGMTDDLEEAVAAGTTMIRVGTALFGPRAPRSPHRGPPSLQQ